MARRPRWWWRAALVACLAPAVACTGEITGGPPGAGGPDGTAQTDDGTPVPSTPAYTVRVPMRRLSHTEYRWTLESLFPDVDLPEIGLIADPEPYGFDNDGKALVPSSVLVEAYDTIAGVVAERAVDAGLQELLGCDPAQGESCTRDFVARFGRRAFRRPLSEQEELDFHAFFDDGPGAGDVAVGAELTVRAMLQAPQFLYRIEEVPAAEPFGSIVDDPAQEYAPLDDYAIASRLSYFLWGTMPDEPLLAAADAGLLTDPVEVETQARRMLGDWRAERAFWHFFEQWMHLEEVEQVSKNDGSGFDESVRQSMVEEAERFVTDIVFGEDGTLEDLLTSNRTFVNADLAPLYGLDAPSEGWAEVELDPQRRAGFLTQLAFLTGHGHPNNPSPVLRGVYVLRSLLCYPLGPPPPVAMGVPPPDGSLPVPNRQAYDDLTSAKECTPCHKVINPVGFAFEHYDTMGRWRDEDNGFAVDATGSFGADMTFDGAVDLAQQLATDERVSECMTKSWLRFAYGSEGGIADKRVPADVHEAFVGAGTSIKELLVSIVTHPRFASYAVAPYIETSEAGAGEESP